MLALLLASIPAVCAPSVFCETPAVVAIERESIEVTGEHFRIVSDFADNELGQQIAEQALLVVEATWPAVAELVPVPRKMDELLTVYLFREYDGYVAAEAKTTGGKFKDNWGFSSHDTLASYVPIQPPLEDSTLSAIGLPFQTQRILAHEAAHLICYVSFSNFKSHPDWLAEGLTSFTDQVVMQQIGSCGDPMTAPHYASDVGSLLDLLDAGKLPAIEQILLGDTSALNKRQTYSLHSFLFSFLAEKKQRGKLAKVLTAARKLGGGSNYEGDLKEAFLQKFGKSGFEKLDGLFAAYLRGKQPEWTEVFRSMGGAELVQIAFPNTNAVSWRRSAPRKSSYLIAGEVQIIQGGQMNLLLDRTDAGFVSIAIIGGDQPSVTIFDYQTKGNSWNRVGYELLADLPTGDRLEFALDASPGKFELSLGGSVVAKVSLPDHKMEGAWGLGAQSGSGGIWRLSRLPKE